MVKEWNGNMFEWKLLKAGPGQSPCRIFDVGVVSRNVKRFNDYYFQVDVNFCVNRHLIVRFVVFYSVLWTYFLIIVEDLIWWRKIINWRGAAKILRQDSNNVLQLERGARSAHKISHLGAGESDFHFVLLCGRAVYTVPCVRDNGKRRWVAHK